MQNFLRYRGGDGKLVLCEEIMKTFLVLEALYSLGRVGEQITSHRLAAHLDTSVYKARKMVHSLHEIGLTDWETVPHRSNADKRIYKITPRGRAVLMAYEDNAMPSEVMA